ncbi:hypothetical protein EVAR_29084_1 [Eumeta japonica]|uniref:Uncharacterized protein n=1 Tax=Eumeta variegata TaxID=151549 RepID=A0A4C1VPQ1_EUMVA|nr:hypothetical protein EVAR_29084_1 [Eumeta japonica]
MLNARIPWQRSVSRSIKISTSRAHRVLEECAFYTARLGAMLGRIEAILRHRGITSQCAPSRGGRLSTAASPTFRRPRNVLIDPPDALTAAVDSLDDVSDTHD